MLLYFHSYNSLTCLFTNVINSFSFQALSAALSLGAVFTVVYLDDENRKLKERIEAIKGKNYGAHILANCLAVNPLLLMF